nr:hypothetical protein KPHV_87060 [Kitasatospora purpeofusca]
MPIQPLARGEARLYRRYTGSPPAYLKNPNAPRPLPLADAPGAGQEVLEHRVLMGLRGGELFTAHPLSIAWSRVLPDRTLVRLDRTGFAVGDRYDVAARVLEVLLPYADPRQSPGDGVQNTSGLRAAVGPDGLHLTSAEHSGALVVLTGPDRVRWKDLLAERHAELEQQGHQPLWEQERFTEQEHAQGQALLPRQPWEWVGSALLRRIGLFASDASTAYRVDYWESPVGTLSVELAHAHPALPDHDRLVADLTDPAFGMPAVVADHYCSCRRSLPDRPYTRDASYGRHCHTTLAHRDGRPGRINLRFASSPARRDANTLAAVNELRRQLASVGTPGGRLRRILPPAPLLPSPADLARERAACTGETYGQAAAGIASARRAFPPPLFAQMRLEGEIALALGAVPGGAGHPLGIRSLRPEAGLLTVEVEARPAAARRWAALLPPPGTAGPVPGLRHQLAADGLHLVREEPGGGTARVHVTGLTEELWQQTLAAPGTAANTLPGVPWSTWEAAAFDAAGNEHTEYRVGSALLRMIRALNGPAGTAVRLRREPRTLAGVGPWQWELDLSHGPDHDILLRLLTDPGLALGADLVERECTCASGGDRCVLVLAWYGHLLRVSDHRGRRPARGPVRRPVG